VDLARYEYADEGRTAWCVPASVLNTSAETRLLTDADLDAM
jgi:hypothetical protein